MKPLAVTFERWDDGWWTARIAAVKGVHADGRTLDEARRRVREALALAQDEGWNEKKAASVELVDDVRVSEDARAAIAAREEAMRALQAAAERVEATTQAAVSALVDGMGVGMRDVARFLDLSHQRVHQLHREIRASEDIARRARALLDTLRRGDRVVEADAPYGKRHDRRAAVRRRR